MSDITHPFRNWINFHRPMKGLEASLSFSLSLSSIASVRELISPNGLLTSYLARNWTFFPSVEPSIYFRILRKGKCTYWSQGTPFSNSASSKSQRTGVRGIVSFFLFSSLCRFNCCCGIKNVYEIHIASKHQQCVG